MIDGLGFWNISWLKLSTCCLLTPVLPLGIYPRERSAHVHRKAGIGCQSSCIHNSFKVETAQMSISAGRTRTLCCRHMMEPCTALERTRPRRALSVPPINVKFLNRQNCSGDLRQALVTSGEGTRWGCDGACWGPAAFYSQSCSWVSVCE